MSLAFLKMKLKGKKIILNNKPIIIPIIKATVRKNIKAPSYGNADLAELVRSCMTIRLDFLK